MSEALAPAFRTLNPAEVARRTGRTLKAVYSWRRVLGMPDGRQQGRLTDFAMSFGQHLRALREGAGLSRSEGARKAGIPASTLRGWEGGRGFPGLPALLRLAEALGVPVERFAEGVEDPNEDETTSGP